MNSFGAGFAGCLGVSVAILAVVFLLFMACGMAASGIAHGVH